ncbi:carboxymuconolactone decarboxylase family protein [Micromonospora radicis]|uniref:carboxymuconolactone decarboxylase family protein n=1 Tax=Micromonospora radicis TaxID=1894971 RepID=UPI001F3BECDC|nr:carboxymuconolactone decarboxylase family protein [Micromonospora radicis]
MIQRQVRYVSPVPAASATGVVAEVYAQVADEMRLVVPPALMHSPSPDVLAAYWALVREPMVTVGPVDRGTKEAVAAAVSVANICPYCADMHTVGMYDLSGEQAAEAVAADRLQDLVDPALRAVTAWARTAHQLDDAVPAPPGLTAGDRAELLGVVVAFHYLTRMVNVFLANFLLPPGLAPWSRRRLKQGISRVMRPTLRDPRVPGRSLDLLPTAPLPPEASWAAPRPAVAAAVAGAHQVFRLAAERTVSAEVRDLLTDYLAGWRGAETGISTAWCEQLIADLPPADRAVARLCLLTAVASYQVDGEVVGEFRRHHPTDRSLVDAAAWAAWSASALIGTRQAALSAR